MTSTIIRMAAVALALFVLACGTPRAAVVPQPTEDQAPMATIVPTAAPTAGPEPTVTAAPEPTEALGKDISHVELGDAWPLTVEKGYILCMGSGKIVLQTDRGLFAVNGTARGANKWKDIRDITKPDPKIKGLLMNVQPIIDRGLAVCR